jgi:transitional endoplasmic reticulum ATPase
MTRFKVEVVALTPEAEDAFWAAAEETPLRNVLDPARYRLLRPLTDRQADLPLRNFAPRLIQQRYVTPGTHLYLPPGPEQAVPPPEPDPAVEQPPRKARGGQQRKGTRLNVRVVDGSSQRPEKARFGEVRPSAITEREATELAYLREISRVASLLRVGLSVLVVCEKIIVGHLWEQMVTGADRRAVPLEVDMEPDSAQDESGGMFGGLGATPSFRARQLARLRELLRTQKEGDVVVIPHLDLLAGGSDASLAMETREIVELVFRTEGIMLAFVDPTLTLPEVVAERFSVRVTIAGSPRMVVNDQGEECGLERVLVTQAEADRFAGFDETDFYKYVGGMNPVRLRQAMAYAYAAHEGNEGATVAELRDTVRAFKAQTSANFEVPNVTFRDIGGYDDVKNEIKDAIDLLLRSTNVEERLRSELIPRGFIFYGPPGTGKTLFAKAIANEMDATIQVVSGPEVTNMYVGESERRVRELFAEARRNAPSVLVFDEFDSIAGQRSGWTDGGARAGNAVVAQILTEMDGFRPDVPMLVIGTTNRIDIIDEALLRPSRFQAIPIQLPDGDTRRQIIEVHRRNFEVDLEPGVLELLTEATEGRNGDEIRSIFRDAYRREKQRGIPADTFQLGELAGRLQRAERERRNRGGV